VLKVPKEIAMAKRERRKKPETEAEELAAAQAFVNESDRGIVLIQTQNLDHALEVLLRSRMRQEKLAAQFFEGANPLLGSFWAKTATAYAFGFIEKAVYEVLELIREIRNDCAHDPGPVELNKDSRLARLIQYLSPEMRQYFEVVMDQWGHQMEIAKHKGIEVHPALSAYRIQFICAAQAATYNIINSVDPNKEIPDAWALTKPQ